MPTRKIAARYAWIELTSRDTDQGYSRVLSIVFGLLHIFFGLFSVALGIGAVCTRASGYFIAYGIWCGFIFIVVGIISLVSACVRTSGMITSNMAFNVVDLCTAIVQFSLAIVAAANDNSDTRYSSSYLSYRYDIYYSAIHDWKMCAGPTHFEWRQWGGVDVLLILVGAFEAVIAIASIVQCSTSICCGTVITQPVEDPEPTMVHQAPNGYFNEAYGATTPPLQYR